ncbi:hypothetical protein MTO96_033706 [Rhipicephalus appendiculatus]
MNFDGAFERSLTRTSTHMWTSGRQMGMFDAHKVFKKLAEVGVLGITRPVEYGGLNLDYSFTVAFAEELSAINCGGIVSGILVHSDMCTPALTNFGSDELKGPTVARTLPASRRQLSEKETTW